MSFFENIMNTLKCQAVHLFFYALASCFTVYHRIDGTGVKVKWNFHSRERKYLGTKVSLFVCVCVCVSEGHPFTSRSWNPNFRTIYQIILQEQKMLIVLDWWSCVIQL